MSEDAPVRMVKFRKRPQIRKTAAERIALENLAQRVARKGSFRPDRSCPCQDQASNKKDVAIAANENRNMITT